MLLERNLRSWVKSTYTFPTRTRKCYTCPQLTRARLQRHLVHLWGHLCHFPSFLHNQETKKKKDLLIVKNDNMLARYLGCNKVFMDSIILDFHVSASIVSLPLLDVYKQTFSFSLDHVIQWSAIVWKYFGNIVEVGKSNFHTFVQFHSGHRNVFRGMEMFKKCSGNILEIKLPYCGRGPVFGYRYLVYFLLFGEVDTWRSCFLVHFYLFIYILVGCLGTEVAVLGRDDTKGADPLMGSLGSWVILLERSSAKSALLELKANTRCMTSFCLWF